ncbi:hypothetical protein HDU99_004721, partial [Rhizoclosmatium hyalinum]
MNEGGLRRRAIFGEDSVGGSGSGNGSGNSQGERVNSVPSRSSASVPGSTASASNTQPRTASATGNSYAAAIAARQSIATGQHSVVSVGIAALVGGVVGGGVKGSVLGFVIRTTVACLLSLASTHAIALAATSSSKSKNNVAIALFASAPVIGLVARLALLLRRDWLPFGASMILRPEGKYGQRELNELLVYILSAVLLLGPVYAAIDAFYQRRTHAFASVHRKWSASMIASIPTILARSIRLSILYSVSYHILFTLVLRRPLYSFFASTVSIFTETVTRNPIVSIPLFSLPSLLELILTTWYIILLWETLYTSLETTYSLPLSHTPTLPLILPPLKSSLSETTPKATYETSLVFLDLARIATGPEGRTFRDNLFNNLSHIEGGNQLTPAAYAGGFQGQDVTTSVNSAWIQIAAACLVRVNRLKDTLTTLQKNKPASSGTGKSKDGGGIEKKKPVGGSITALKLGDAGNIMSPASPIKRAKLLTGAVKPSPVKNDNVIGTLLDSLQETSDSASVPSMNGSAADPKGLYKVGNSKEKTKAWHSAVSVESVVKFVGLESVVKKLQGLVGPKKGKGLRRVTKEAFADYEVISL